MSSVVVSRNVRFFGALRRLRMTALAHVAPTPNHTP